MSILDDILANTRGELAERKKKVSVSALRDMPLFTRTPVSLAHALAKSQPSIIAEIKRASPSKGIIRKECDALTIAQGYQRAGAAALSVLTDSRYFHGNLSYIREMRERIRLPILRKDFIVDEYQLVEAKAYGADAVLLIAAALLPNELSELHAAATSLELDCLVEIHNRRELESLDLASVRIIGINNRDLATFVTDPAVTEELAPLLPDAVTVVSESGITTAGDMTRLMNAGADAFLIGELFMAAPDPGEALAALIRGVAAETAATRA